MKSNRREFLKYSGLTGVSLALANMMKGFGANTDNNLNVTHNHLNETHFNMCGYAASKLDKVRIGFIGLGN